jgi:hypothetical protein
MTEWNAQVIDRLTKWLLGLARMLPRRSVRRINVLAAISGRFQG